MSSDWWTNVYLFIFNLNKLFKERMDHFFFRFCLLANWPTTIGINQKPSDSPIPLLHKFNNLPLPPHVTPITS